MWVWDGDDPADERHFGINWGNNTDTGFKITVSLSGSIYTTKFTVQQVEVKNTLWVNSQEVTSDDRIKTNEVLITNSIDILLKLRPQKYEKYIGIDKINNINTDTKQITESGLIAQELYYEAPELRHLVNVPSDATLIDNSETRDFEDIQNDPDYSNWGEKPASVNYIGLIPYLIKGIQEQQTEINTLKTENSELTNIINKLKTANSFEEFKQSL